ncbi:MAG: Fe(3+) ABC transporter substrate-binding protein [Pseudomonadota bacterium]
MKSVSQAIFAIILGLALQGCGEATGKRTEPAPAPPVVGEVNVYSGRHYDSDLAIYDAFTRKTGIKVNLIEAGGDELIERLSREAEASPADLFITADAGMLWRAKARGVLRPIKNPEILARVPAHFRDADNDWVGLSKRARIIIYNKSKGAPEGLATYADLTKPEFRGKICVRSSTNVYNQSLLASMIGHVGDASAEKWAEGVVANFARKPEGVDTTQIEDVAAGVCDISIVNTYYLARYLGSDDRKMRSIGEKVGFLFPNQQTTGTHVNVSGAGVARYAPNPENAEALIAYLLSDEAQQAFAAGNNEYPLVEGVAPVGPVASFGAFRADDIDMTALGEHQAEAVKIFDKAGWQ